MSLEDFRRELRTSLDASYVAPKHLDAAAGAIRGAAGLGHGRRWTAAFAAGFALLAVGSAGLWVAHHPQSPRVQPNGAGIVATPTPQATSSPLPSPTASPCAPPTCGEPHGQDVLGAHLIDATHAWVITAGHLWLTSDGGSTWADRSPGALQGSAQSGPGSNLAASFLDATRGWLVEADAPAGSPPVLAFRLWSTANGGVTWSAARRVVDRSTPYFAGYAVREVWFVDSVHGWAIADGGSHAGQMYESLLRTSDGGATWRGVTDPNVALPQQLHDVQHVIFSDPLHGVSSGEPTDFTTLSITADGGQSWHQLNLPPPKTHAGEVSYLVPSFVGPFGLEVVGFGNPSTGISAFGAYSSDDGGQHWTYRGDAPTADVAALGARGYWFVIGKPDFAITADAGASWRSFPSVGLPYAPVMMEFRGANMGLAVLSVGGCTQFKSDCYSKRILMRTSDGGKSWAQSLPGG